MKGLPSIAASREAPDLLELDFDLAADCPWLVGHFPGQPILPGVVQVGWAVHFAARVQAGAAAATGIRRLKFRRPVLPGARLTLRLQRQGEAVSFEYLLHAAEGTCSASGGLLEFGADR